MSADRPDVTESPITVDAGHVQIELSLFDLTRDRDDGVRTRSIGIFPANVKLGLTNNLDIQFVFTPYQRIETSSGGQRDVIDGFSDDTQIRLKINLWGNDGPHPVFGNTAFAVMPFVKFPTGCPDELGNDRVEGGIILPFAADLPGGWGLGLMAEVDLVYNEEDDDYGLDFVHTATLSRAVPGFERLGFFVEYIGIAPIDTGATYQALGSGGLTFAINHDWMLDCGVTAGISDSADDIGVFVGTTVRF